MKTIEDFCKKNKLKMVKTKYHFKNYSWNGFDIIKPESNAIVIAFEPVEKMDGSRWYIRMANEDYTGPRYLKRITTKFLNTLNIKSKSIYFLNK